MATVNMWSFANTSGPAAASAFAFAESDVGSPTMPKQYLGSVIVGALILLCLSGFGKER